MDNQHNNINTCTYVSPEEVSYALTPKIPSNIMFCLQDKEVLRFNEDGIFFNKEDFTQFTADDFVREFIHILESKFTVKFTKEYEHDKLGYVRDDVTVTKADLPTDTLE